MQGLATLKAISIRQPYAQYIVRGRKTIEVRSWATRFKGHLVICATRQPDIPKYKLDELSRKEGIEFPLGMAVGIVRMVRCRPLTRADMEGAMIPEEYWENVMGQYAWELIKPIEIEPFPVKGKLGFFMINGDFKYKPFIGGIADGN